MNVHECSRSHVNMKEYARIFIKGKSKPNFLVVNVRGSTQKIQ